MQYQIYDLCLYPIKLKDKRGEHGAATEYEIPACPIINMFSDCRNSCDVRGPSGDMMFPFGNIPAEGWSRADLTLEHRGCANRLWPQLLLRLLDR